VCGEKSGAGFGVRERGFSNESLTPPRRGPVTNPDMERSGSAGSNVKVLVTSPRLLLQTLQGVVP
jgi:hypothetical protein